MNVIMGVDPGLSGGVALVSLDASHAVGIPMPVIKSGKRRDLDGRALAHWIGAAIVGGEAHVCLVVVEKVHSMPKQGMASTFAFGVGFGRVLGVIEALDLPLEQVAPQLWKKAILAGTDLSKDAAVAYCMSRFPGIAMPKKGASRHGIAEAACLAEFGRRLVLGRPGG